MSIQTPIRHCEDCKFYQANAASVEYDRCTRPRDVGAAFLVRRSEATEPSFCKTQRGYDVSATCGPTAKFFEPAVDVEHTAEAAE